jgi:hypothetical protein
LRGANLVVVAAGLLLLGCATESQLGPIGGTSDPAAAGAEGGGFGQAQTAGVDCPGVTIRSGASAWQVPAGSRPTEVHYQASLVQLARECAVLGETMTMRVGVEGRVAVGPRGGPGDLEVPIRIALVQEGTQPRPIWSEFYSVKVAVPPNASQAIFSHVEDDLTFPLPADRNLERYVVYVGFDPQGAAAAARASKSKAPARTSAPAAKATPTPRPASQPQSQPKQQAPQFEPPPGAPATENIFAPPPGHSG